MNTIRPDSTISNIQFTIAASDGERIYCDARFPSASSELLPVIIFVHGFKGFKDWGWGPYLTAELARHGLYVLSFNFTHSGVEGNGSEFTQLDRFARNTYSREVRELREVVDAVATGNVPRAELVNSQRIALLGHSRGGGIVMLEAHGDERVTAVATWAAVSDFDRFTERQKALWKQQGYFETKNMRTGQIMPLNVTLLEDLEQHSDDLDIGAAAAALGKPLLILHGEQDLTVRLQEGERLAALADPEQTDFETIPHTAHTFGVVHPFEGTTPELEHAIERTAAFFKRHL